MTPEQFGEIREALGRIEQKVDGHQDDDRRIHARQDAAIDTLYSKTNDLDRSRSRMRGGMSVLGILFTGFLALIGLNIWE
jgi:hypothetical protein